MQKNILITGSTDGIGKLAAIKLASEGHTVYLHGRTKEKVDAVAAEISEVTGNENIQTFVTDFSDLTAVREMAAHVVETIPRLDVLINNAGVLKTPVPKNKDGLDLRMVVNYLAPYVLTSALLPTLQQSNIARVINLSSAAQSSVALDVLAGEAAATEFETYSQSKLALTMWSFYLAEQSPDVSVIAVNPGSLLNTNMVKEGFGHHRASADVGADILYDLTTQHEGVTGQYFNNDTGDYGKAHLDAYDKAKIKALIEATDSLLVGKAQKRYT